MTISGKWWLVWVGAAFDRDESHWYRLEGGAVSDKDGRGGTYAVTQFDLVITLEPAQPGESAEQFLFSTSRSWIVDGTPQVPISADTEALDGEIYDDPCSLWRDGPWVDELTESNRECGNRYSTIDVSMYDHASPAVAALRDASGVAEIEAALARLPLGKVTHG